jgi:hypothetical protein
LETLNHSHGGEEGLTLYDEVKKNIEEALFPLFREQCPYLNKKALRKYPKGKKPKDMSWFDFHWRLLYECKHSKNKFMYSVKPGELPNCACSGCPIYP